MSSRSSKVPGQARLNRRSLLRWAGAVVPFIPTAAAAQASLGLGRGAISPAQLERTAGNWTTWLIPKGSSLNTPPPPGAAASQAEAKSLLQYQQGRTPAVRAAIALWDEQGGLRVWSQILLDKIKETNTNPVLASRALGLLHAGLADALIATWDAKWKYARVPPSVLVRALRPLTKSSPILPGYPSEHAAVAVAAAGILDYLFPASNLVVVNGEKLTFDQVAEQAMLSRLYAAANYPSDLDAGAAIGEAIAQAAITRATNDGSSEVWNGVTPVGPPNWAPTPPALQQNPLLPLAGQWSPWHLSSGDQFRPAAPDVYANGAFSPAFLAQVQEVASVAASLTPAQKQIATFWADGAGTVTPPGHWMEFALAHVARADSSAPRAARALALLGTGLADAAVACWDAKYAYWVLRPVTAIRTIQGQSFSNPNFVPFIATPPFPSYTSGHSTFSATAATILEQLFPGGKVADAFGKKVRFGAAAQQAAVSRLYGGIHYTMDNQEGLVCGGRIGKLVLERLTLDRDR